MQASVSSRQDAFDDDLHETTLPFGQPELMRASAFHRHFDGWGDLEGCMPAGTRLKPSLLADLQRFEHAPGGTEAVEVMAACLRHAQAVAVHLDAGGVVLPVSVFPRERLFHCPADPATYLQPKLAVLRVLRVEPALVCPPSGGDTTCVAPGADYHPLGPLLWALAMEGSRCELLPEIAGPACYRTPPGMNLQGLDIHPAVRTLIRCMCSHPVTLRDLAEVVGLGREDAARLLNALYLQSGLIVSRSGPTAPPAPWMGQLRRRRG